MRLVTWNCNMAFHKKLDALWKLRPDVAVVQEVEEPTKWHGALSELAGHVSVTWTGANPKKGLAVLGFNGVRVERDASYREGHDYVVPVEVRGRAFFNLLAVWSFNDRGIPGRTKVPGPISRALLEYSPFCGTAALVVLGDFNHSVVWDRLGSVRNMRAIISEFDARDLFSAYHVTHDAAFGQEPEPTHYWRDRKKNGLTYHIDYCFLPNLWRQHVGHVEVGSFEDWCERRDKRPSLSDHVPLVVDVDDRAVAEKLGDDAQRVPPSRPATDIGQVGSRISAST